MCTFKLNNLENNLADIFHTTKYSIEILLHLVTKHVLNY